MVRGVSRNKNGNREPHAKLLVSICRLMGLSDVNGVGDINANSGPLAGIG